MSNPDYDRKRSLECLRLAAECMQLASDVRIPDVQTHFIRTAKFWTAEAERETAAETEVRDIINPAAYP